MWESGTKEGAGPDPDGELSPGAEYCGLGATVLGSRLMSAIIVLQPERRADVARAAKAAVLAFMAGGVAGLGSESDRVWLGPILRST
jgi:hypothetical protein